MFEGKPEEVEGRKPGPRMSVLTKQEYRELLIGTSQRRHLPFTKSVWTIHSLPGLPAERLV